MHLSPIDEPMSCGRLITWAALFKVHCDDGVRKYCTPEQLLLLQLVAVQSCVPQLQQQLPHPSHICPSLDPIGALMRSVNKAG